MLQTNPQTLSSAFLTMKAAADADPYPAIAERRKSLKALLALVEDHEAEFCAAINADFGGRSAAETRMAEVTVVRAGIRHALSHLSRWMRQKRVATSMVFWPARNRLLPQPLGVVGIVSPWNYPLQLALAPATAALAAGNRLLIKPSELTPVFSRLLAELMARYFPVEQVQVITGDADVGKAFVSLPFDHLLFTGSTAVGREVAKAAAENLTPVTLELGGKSPAIIDPSCDLDSAVKSIAFGKLLNAGQTCIAPDYLLVPKGKSASIAVRLETVIRRHYPTLVDNPDYTAIISPRHHARLEMLVEEAEARGVVVTRINPAKEDLAASGRKFAPTLLQGVDPDLTVMREEIFGPILPIVEYDGIDAAIAYVNERDRPLALYWFGTDAARRERILHETISGGVTINDCLMHLAQENQPFGGVGPSGMGAYHGEWGFRTFSKEKPILHQSKFAAGALLRPPYGATFERLLKLSKLLT